MSAYKVFTINRFYNTRRNGFTPIVQSFVNGIFRYYDPTKVTVSDTPRWMNVFNDVPWMDVE